MKTFERVTQDLTTNRERILDYLWSVGPAGATNAQICAGTGVDPHAQVYVLTQELKAQHKFRSRKRGREWEFFIGESPKEILGSPGHAALNTPLPKLTASQFEEMARTIFSQLFGIDLQPGLFPGITKLFDFVSADGTIAWDAKYYTLVRGDHLPLAMFSIIAESVWLLEKTRASRKFLVCRNDIEVPKQWLARYGNLRGDVEFYFLSDEGIVEKIS